MNRTTKPARRALLLSCLLLLATIAACSVGGSPADQQWLHGTWQLEFNPDFESEDNLIFQEDGTMVIETEDLRIIEGSYQVDGDELRLELIVDHRPVDVAFEISADRSKLIYRTGAYYIRTAAPR